jgi:ABC-type phosphate/phosphonate transport system substrate-binding protein
MGICRSVLLFSLLAALAGCDAYPRDMEGTLDKVESQKIVRVGLIASPSSATDRSAIASFLARLTRATGASPRIVAGSAEPLLLQLESDRLDLVIGEIAPDSPWITDVAVIEPLAVRSAGDRQIGLSPVARNGENRWIGLLERLARDHAGGR